MTRQLQLRTLGALDFRGGDDDLLSRRRIDFAFLVVLAARMPGAVRREELQTLFWGERTEDRARQSLRQVAMRLRRACGDALISDARSLRLVESRVVLDVRLFESAASAGRYAEAIDLWNGEFLIGCDDIGAEGFRTWLEVERERLRRMLSYCYEHVVDDLARGERWDEALRFTTTWTERFPLEERPSLRHIEALCAIGRLADAESTRAGFLRRLETEMEETPDAAWLTATSEWIRRAERRASERASVLPPSMPVTVVEQSVGDSPVDAPTSDLTNAPSVGATSSVPQRRRRFARLAAAAVVFAIALFSVRIAVARTDRAPTIAVGDLSSTFSNDSLRGFATLLTIDLARIEGLDVITERRLNEVAARSGATRFDDAARAAGARELIDGVVTVRPNGTVRADLRRIDLATRKTRAAYTVEGADLTQLADLVTERVARDLNLDVPLIRREASTTSIIAYRLYEQGLRAYYENDSRSAIRLFNAALTDDSTFAMAAFYKGLAMGGDSAFSNLGRALRYAERTTERERLLIRTVWGRWTSDPRVLAWAETLVTRFPGELDAQLVYATELARQRRFTPALAHYRYVLTTDSSTQHAAGRCLACEAASGMIDIYLKLDSLDAADRVSSMWLRWQPQSHFAWAQRSRALGDAGRFSEAHAAVDSAARYPWGTNDPLWHAVWWFRANDFASVDRAWREMQHSTNPDQRTDALWTGVISLRTQGRMREALDVARRYRRERLAQFPTDGFASALEALVLLESGRPRVAAVMFDSMAQRTYKGPTPSSTAVHRASQWTYTAAAYATAGDTAALGWLEDSVRVYGANGTPRHARLHHYIRGLRLSARRQHSEAADAFRQAVWGRGETFVRIYLELGRSLLAAGRSAEAVDALVEGLKGPNSAAGLYATRSELQELLGRAYEQSGQLDSALVQYRLASDAWRQGDPEFARRRAAVNARIAALSRLESAKR
jgi:DNA-binding SARP family transcriptional activator